MKKGLLCTISAVLCCVFAFPFVSACDNTENPQPETNQLDIFDAAQWRYMTNHNGASLDNGGTPYTLDDGSIKFHNANQAIELEKDYSNDYLEFGLKASDNWQLWFLASTIDNNENNCYKLIYLNGKLCLSTSETTKQIATADASKTQYKVNEWNKVNVNFVTEDNLCTISLTINDSKVNFSVANQFDRAEVVDGNFVHTRDENFYTGNYLCAKVWYGNCFMQLRPVKDIEEGEVTKIACIGDSITYGANATNSYTDSYPAQLQELITGKYNVMNFGKSGATLRSTADDPYTKTAEFKGVQSFVPDIAIVMLGSNDSKTYQEPTQNEITAHLKSFIDQLYEINDRMEIYIATCPYAYSTAYQISNYNIEKIIIPAKTQTAEDMMLNLIPMHEYTKNMSGCYADGIHPTTRGYTYIAYRVYCHLEGLNVNESYVNSFKDN